MTEQSPAVSVGHPPEALLRVVNKVLPSLLRTPVTGPLRAADQARKTDPQLAAKYKRLMGTERHHDSALCHIATILLTRIATCWRTGQHYVLRDTDGRTITPEEGRRIVRAHHAVDRQTRQYPPIPAA